MARKCGIILLGICFLSVWVTANAADYKSWIPLLPKSLGGLARAGRPDGLNMQMGDKSWSSLRQEYGGNDSSSNIRVTIVQGLGSPQLQSFQMLTHMKMETEEQVVKTTKVSGYGAVLQLDRVEKSGSLMLLLHPGAMVIINARPVSTESQMLDLARKLPLGRIAAQTR